MRLWVIVGLLAFAPSFAFTQETEEAEPHNSQPFDVWLAELKQEALAAGIHTSTVEAALSDIAPLPQVIELDRKQPETTQTQEEYLERVVTQTRIDRASELLSEHRALLDQVSEKYGVPPEVIVALWGIETNFGDRMGEYHVVESLATLAYDGRRSDFFRGEVMNALHIIDGDHIRADEMLGSWAGAMGQCQFMPSSYLRYAVDENGDGKRDIWETQADVFASIANYLRENGWKQGENWGQSDGNYNVFLRWNRSRYFATAVAMLAHSARE